MKIIKSFSIIILLAVLAACEGGNKQLTDDLIIVNINANYPVKELILQDFMDVEYVALETSDEFVTQGFVQAIGKDMNENGELKGKLKEIAAQLDEESNPVIMLVKHKL